METFLILAAVAALAISGVMISSMVVRARRPDLRMGREEDLEADGEETLMRSVQPPQPSPIDRSAPVLEVESPVPPKRLTQDGRKSDEVR